MRTYYLENLHEREQLEDTGVDKRIILKWMLRKQGGKMWNGLVCLRIGTSGGLL
jgi:hypothetical protein